MDEATRNLFKDYEAAFDRLDIGMQADFFAETFISAGPRGTIAQGRDQFMQMSHKAADFYRGIGQTGAKILSMKEVPIGKFYSMVTVHWGVTFRKLGEKPVEFDVSYFIQKSDPEKPQIIMFIAHQDEDEAMKELGLLNDQPSPTQ